jgi:asparagine synthase (glutamine-hydrolysing)
LQRTNDALRALTHRGPDDSGIWSDTTTVIGHRRLSIIDVAGNRQPIADPTNRFIFSFNGEIYNYKDLRPALTQHWPFRTSGDTEVLLAGLVLHGESFLSRLEGMWAFALWDTRTGLLLLGRDRLGKKPLYYQTGGDGIACASELRALRKLSGGIWEEDPASTADYFRYGYYLPGTTAYRDVREVLPGNVLHWSAAHGVRQTPYWRLSVGHYAGTYAQACLELKEKMIIAVRRRMVADVEVGAFLSGGVDSSLIVGIMTQELGIHPKTFTIGFENKTYDESAYARAMSERWGTDHHEHRLKNWDRDLLSKLVLEHVGQPFCDSSLLPTAQVSQLAAHYVKVALSGDGGDELFSGYQRYHARMLLRWYTRLPRALRQAARKIIQRLPEPFSHHSRSLLKKAHLFFDITDRLDAETPYVAPVFYSNTEFANLVPDLASAGQAQPFIPAECHADAVQEMMVADGLVYLPQDILAKVDRASMAYSLESRCPFLDRDVVELAYSLPRAWHRDHFNGKRLLRDSFAQLLPRSVLNRRKQGFAVPVHDWFRQDLAGELETLLHHSTSPLSHEYVMAMLANHRAGRRDHGYRLWGIYIYLLWLTAQKTHAS